MKTKSKSKRNQVTVELNRRADPLPTASSREIKLAAPSFKLKNILVPVDFSDCSRQALDYAIPFALQFHASIALLHVIHVNYYAASNDYMAFDYPELIEETRRAGEKQLGDRARSIRKKYPVKTVLETGHPGSRTAEHVVRYALCPVLTVPGRTAPARSGQAPPFKLKKILVPIDFSEVSKDTLPHAAFLAAHFGAEVILLHVVQKFPIDYLLGRALMSETIVPLMKQAGADLERMAAGLSKSNGAHMSAVVRTGKPFEEICRVARTLGADMIVLTTHGSTGLKHVVLGSTAERVVRHANCPVLVVRNKARVGGGKRSAEG